MDTMQINPAVRGKIRAICNIYDNGRNDLLELLRVNNLGKRGPALTLEMAIESVDDDIESLLALKAALKGEQAMGHLKESWGMK